MANLTLHEVLLPTFTNGLLTLDHILTSAEKHASSNGLDADAEYPDARLAADMRPLSFQVHNAASTVKRALERIGAVPATDEWVPFDEGAAAAATTTIADLRARVDAALGLARGVDAGVVDARAEELVDLPFRGEVLKLKGKDFILKQAIPNYFFHLQTAYAILRSKGVPIGKLDYISSFVEDHAAS